MSIIDYFIASLSFLLGDVWGERTEVKNINGVKNLHQAINYEIKRHISVLENGGKVVRETRMFDETGNCTRSIRDKEQNADYRFMPEPNLPPLVLYNDETAPDDDRAVNVDLLRRTLPPLPSSLRELLLDKYQLKKDDCDFLLEREMAVYLVDVLSAEVNLKPNFVNVTIDSLYILPIGLFLVLYCD